MNPNFNPFLNNFNFIPNPNLNNFYQNMPGINNNNFPYPNFMNNQFPMFQNMNNQINNNNNINQNQNINNQDDYNINFKNQHQKKLVDKIIDFYQKNGRKYMNYFEPNQIKKLLDNLDTNSPNLKEGNDIDDPMPYIKEKKKLIKFINHDFKIFNVKVPISIDKMTLYQIAKLYKTFNSSKVLLIYMNCALNEDESSILSISNDDYVIIIENIYYLDDSYLNSLNNINNSNEQIVLSIKKEGTLKALPVLKGTKFSHLIKALLFDLGCNYGFLYNGKTFYGEHEEMDWEILNLISIECVPISVFRGYIFFGRKIFLNTIFSDEKGTEFSHLPKSLPVGLLNSIKSFITMIEYLSDSKVQRINLDGEEINFEEDRSILSLGIKEDSTLFIILKTKV